MKCDELKEVMNVMQVSGERIPSGYYKKSDVDAAIAELKAKLSEKDREIALLKEHIANGDVSRITWIDEVIELKQKFEDVQASMYADVVDANMKIRRLQRALYKALANWAKCEERINNRDTYEASEYLPSAEDKFRKKAERWSEMERKCRAKAEEYK